jgi:1-acyl-sn-glycerol-3-phosphate acyltransferase
MSTKIRSLLYLLFLSVTVVVYAVPISIFGRITPYRWLATVGQHWGRMNLWALKRICGLDYRIRGWENLPKENCIVLCKHQSAWETIALRALLPPEHTWVLKKELLRVPFFGWALAAYAPIAIDRSAGRQAMRQLLDEGSYWLERGRWIVIFPEGTRVAPGKRKRYGHGGAILASKTGYPVLPIAHNAGVFWRRRDLNKYPGCVDVVIGEPMPTEGLSSAEINRRVEDWIEDTVSRLPQTKLA